MRTSRPTAAPPQPGAGRRSRGPRRRAALAALLAAATALVAGSLPGHAAAATRLTGYEVEVTGLQQIDWSYLDKTPAEQARDGMWTEGDGGLTLGWSTPTPYRMVGLQILDRRGRPRDPNGFEPNLVGAPPATRALLRRTTDMKTWSIPACEGCGNATPMPLPLLVRCEPRRGTATIDFQRLPLGHWGVVVTPPSGLHQNCPPDDDELEPYSRQMYVLPRARLRIQRMRRGASLTIRLEVVRGSIDERPRERCPRLAGVGLRTCSTATITVEVTRTS